VLDGLFTIVKRLYGITVREQDYDNTAAKEDNQATSLWHDDVHFYQLFDEDEHLLGGFYFDLFARSGKRGGAWMSGFQSRYHFEEQDHQQLPVCFMVGNFTPALAGKPSLLTHNEVLTLFHEFGHGLHHLLTQVTVGDVAGVNGVEWDAVELPSQFMENWAWDAEGIALISSHVETGEPLPQDKLDALLAVKNFQSGLQTLRQIELSLFDLLIHAHAPALDYAGVLATLDTVRCDIALVDTPDYNRFANGFSHIFAGGYAAGYYSYKWAELLSADAFSKFEEDGIFNPVTGKAFRETVLSVGGSFPAKTNFENFRGRSASIEALLRHSGFSDIEKNSEAS
jgi:oligopeptidase A